MNKKKIAIIGSTGLVGSRITEILKEKYQIEEFNASSGFDITDSGSVSQLKNSDSEIVIHLAAKTSVDGCEEDKSLGKKGEAWKTNVNGVENVASICSQGDKKLIYISTDFVFDGELPPEKKYTESSTPNPINWYGQTKFEGEKIVQKLSTPWIIARIAYPYRGDFRRKKDFVHIIKNLLEEGRVLSAVTDHIMSPTYIDDIASSLDILISKNSQGIYHIVGSEALSPFDAVEQIANIFGLDTTQVQSATREEYFADKAPRPYNLALNNGKIVSLGAKMSTFEEGLEKVKSQISKV